MNGEQIPHAQQQLSGLGGDGAIASWGAKSAQNVMINFVEKSCKGVTFSAISV
jgi:hypothetical protein